MRKLKAFVLLEVSCFGFLFLCSVLPFLTFQKDVYRFVQKDKEKLQKEFDFYNMRSLLLERIEENKEEETIYYNEKTGWQRGKVEASYKADIKKVSLFEREHQEPIWYFQIYDNNKEDFVWEGFYFKGR